ncbi:transcription regulator GCR1 KNAG_0A01950 [Huiozyma naganishii CBS 8797]|uniref:Transcription activator GCR1-like domain-containing protein n=1 Tax=Huiozyma naganishii (strain ATCC MYA-139 / BCRC 22969 / CBS 8797 / KCTC 17520 / NBRC 10181 / NCYC 3082 / Yp74L-3) TaxID=1071383 RepID=J7S1Y0_HUIN7|nr:hypothetical protein KNAG_0A01950 [Kazachstania naganishii CBS 8797]CCK67884.1 hypothetical protein KNAG_0A01950 [Kazachstania naganishii CBS 8797]
MYHSNQFSQSLQSDSNDTDPNDNASTNKLQSYLSQQEQQSQTSSSHTTANFYAITQYILQSYFKVEINSLSSLRLIDMIVDQTYPDSLTLRKLNDSNSYQTYQYFNTISRDPDISRCPIFALSVYFVIRWSHPNPSITINNCNSIKLLDANLITYDSDPLQYIQNHLNGNINSTERIQRSTVFEPSRDLIDLVFPWLPMFRQDMHLIDRTNYKLHSLCELFEFMGRIIVQDLRYLNQHALLLPNIVSFMSKFIPDLFQNSNFRGVNSAGASVNNNIDSTANVPEDTGAINPIFNQRAPDVPEGSDPYIQMFNETNDKLNEKVDTRFSELSQKMTTETIRLSQQVNQLKSDLNSLTSMCTQILQGQRQMFSGQLSNAANTPLPTNQYGNFASGSQNSPNNGVKLGGMSSLDRTSNNNTFTGDGITNLDALNSDENAARMNQRQTIAGMPPLDNFGAINTLGHQSQMRSFQQPRRPSIGSNSNRLSPQIKSNAQIQQELTKKRMLPLPASGSMSAHVGSPFSPTSPGNFTTAESPYTKRIRLENKPTPSQTALDMLLSRSVPSPKPPLPTTFRNERTAEQSQINSPTFLLNQPDASESDSESVSITSEPLMESAEQPGNVQHTGGDDSLHINEQSKQANSYPTSKEAHPPSERTLGSGDQQQRNNNTETSGEAQSAADVLSNQQPTLVTMGTKLPIVNSVTNTADSPLKVNKKKSSTGSGDRENKKSVMTPAKAGPNMNIKYKLSRENKTIWDLYAEWYIGINGHWSIKKLIEEYGYRRWKVSDDSHFFPTRRIIMDYIETECDRGIQLGRFTKIDQPREDIRKIIVSDVEKFRINNGLTLNSLSLYFRNLTKRNEEICIFKDFKTWGVKIMTDEEKTRYSKRKHLHTASGGSAKTQEDGESPETYFKDPLNLAMNPNNSNIPLKTLMTTSSFRDKVFRLQNTKPSPLAQTVPTGTDSGNSSASDSPQPTEEGPLQGSTRSQMNSPIKERTNNDDGMPAAGEAAPPQQSDPSALQNGAASNGTGASEGISDGTTNGDSNYITTHSSSGTPQVPPTTIADISLGAQLVPGNDSPFSPSSATAVSQDSARM